MPNKSTQSLDWPEWEEGNAAPDGLAGADTLIYLDRISYNRARNALKFVQWTKNAAHDAVGQRAFISPDTIYRLLQELGFAD